jgi:hypothetical protein
MCRPTSSEASTFPAPTTSGTCSSSGPTSTTSTAGNRSVEFSRSLNPELQTLDQWMAANKDRIPLGEAG